MIVDLRSDTVTRPTPGMLEAMFRAKTGDDVFGEDPSVNQLEAMMAGLFGMEAALYCPTGTMSNQVAIKCHTRPGDEVICERQAHVYIYEGGGIAMNAGSQVRAVEGDRGRINVAQVEASVNPDDVHKARTSLVCLENTSNRGGGSRYDTGEIGKIREFCDRSGLQLHLDGARLFNAIVAGNESAASYGKLFHSISVCLNKGLGCPIGSLLLGPAGFIKKARRVRKVFGGGMRQAGFMAAAGIYALENHIGRLAEDHGNARLLADALSKKPFVESIMPVETNIILFRVGSSGSSGFSDPSGFSGSSGPESTTAKEKDSAKSHAPLTGDAPARELAARLKDKGVLAIAISPREVRMVTHLDITPAGMEHTLQVLEGL